MLVYLYIESLKGKCIPVPVISRMNEQFIIDSVVFVIKYSYLSYNYKYKCKVEQRLSKV